MKTKMAHYFKTKRTAHEKYKSASQIISSKQGHIGIYIRYTLSTKNVVNFNEEK